MSTTFTCCSNSAESEIEFLVRQLKREVEELLETTEARLLMQDGKIAETCVYLKNNLSSEIRNLLDSMKLSGELDEVITSAILNRIELIELKTEEFLTTVETIESKTDEISNNVTSLETTVANLDSKTDQNFVNVYLALEEKADYENLYYIDVHQYERAGKTFTEAMKEACSDGGRTIIVKPGYHELTETIRVKENTRIMMYGAIIKKMANINTMFVNDSDGTIGGYGASHSIHFEGGTLDLNKDDFPESGGGIAVAHITNFSVKNMGFTNIYDWHYIEINSAQRVLIDNCTFTEYGNAAGSEMLQIDLALDENRFPWFGPYDNTCCQDVRITNCNFINGVNGIGSHSGKVGMNHSNIVIDKCIFKNMSKECIYALNYSQLTLTNSQFTNAWKGIRITNMEGNSANYFTIKGNTFTNINAGTSATSRAIEVGQRCHYGTIANNTISNVGLHGIGVDYGEQWAITGNVVTQTGGTGIWGFGVKYSTISDNTVLYSNQSDISRYGIIVGGTNTVNADTTNTTVVGNNVDTVYVQGTTNVFVSTNSIRDSGTFPTGQYDNTNLKAVNNFINGVFA